MNTTTEPYAALLAAEADYLHARGWKPYVQYGNVLWADPKEDEHADRLFIQPVAVSMQKLREPV